MKNLLSLLVLTEVFEQNAIPVIPYLLILLTLSPIAIVYLIARRFLDPPRKPCAAEIADQELLDQVRRGKADPKSWEVKEAEQRVYFGYYDLQAVDNV